MSTLSRFPDYMRALEEVAWITEDDLADLMPLLPHQIVVGLAEGPLPYRFDCGVCSAFGRSFYRNVAKHQPDDPTFRVWAYHEVAKLGMRTKNDEHYGPCANDHYERTIATYRAAGWTGEAQEANA